MPLAIPKGPYVVSTLTFELPARQVLPASRFRTKDKGQDPFQLRTSLVTLFYPTSVKEAKSHAAHGKPLSWLNEPRLKAIEGLLKYGGISRYFAYPAVLALPFSTKLPYASDGPLSDRSPAIALPGNSQDVATTSTGTFPVGVFSHGLAGSRTTYSAYLAELASEGMVIAAVEHRDGSAPYTQIRRREAKGGKLIEEDLIYFKYDELDVAQENEQEEVTIWDMRKAQLAQRQAEVMEAVQLLRDINDGRGNEMCEQSTRTIDVERVNIGQWKDRLDINKIWALGHSFGGATSIELLRRTDTPFTHAIVLDPWLEPIAKANEAGVEKIKRPLFVINSDAFTIWRKHFAWLRELVFEANSQTGGTLGWLITLTKTKHTDFSDFPFLMPRIFRPASGHTPSEVLDVFVKASRAAFLGQKPDADTFDMPWRDERPNEVDLRDLGKTEEAHVILHPLDRPPTTSSSGATAQSTPEQPKL
jgi:platelet-activating factor acetylhydrolase